MFTIADSETIRSTLDAANKPFDRRPKHPELFDAKPVLIGCVK
jgi:hypothetical protein